MEADAKRQLAALPADQRKDAEAAMGDMTRSLKDLREGADVRKRYGDKSAAALQKSAAVLARQRLDAIRMLGGRR